MNANDDHASARFTNAAGAEDLVMDFGGLGMWLYGEAWGPWTQISTWDPNRIKEVKFVGGSQDYELLAESNAGGLYWGNWNGSAFTWTLITNDDHRPQQRLLRNVRHRWHGQRRRRGHHSDDRGRSL